MKTSVIVTTYNSPDSLRLVILALSRQSAPPYEVVVADDGSSDKTAECLARASGEISCRLVHVWQPDDGFRLARSRNNAVHAATGEVLAFLDQDTLPHRRWLEAHRAAAGEHRVCVGRALEMGPETGARLSEEAVLTGGFERMHAAAEAGRLDSVQRKMRIQTFLRKAGFPIGNKPALRGNNFCVYLKTLRSINGFDEEYVGWGQEDDDLGRRLYRSGVSPVPVANRAIVSHLPHERRHKGRWSDGPNVERYVRGAFQVRCARGLDSHPHPEVKLTVLRRG